MVAPRHGEIHVWTMEAAAADARAAMACLDNDERARAGRLSDATRRIGYIAAHGALRRILAWYTGVEPGGISYVREDSGAVRLEPAMAAGLSFSLSHSGSHAAVAVAGGGAVGVDIEEIRAGLDLSAVTAECFTPAERDALERVADEDRTRWFYAAWTRKEAVVKALGRGLSYGLRRVEVPADPTRRRMVVRLTGRADRLCVRTIDMGECCAGAVAFDRPRLLRRYRFTQGEVSS